MLAQAFIENLPMIVETGLQIIVSLMNGLVESLPTMIPTIIDVVLTIVQTLVDNADLLVDGAIALMLGLTMGLIEATPTLIEKVPDIIVSLVEAFVRNAPKLIGASLKMITTMATALITYVPLLVAKAPEVINRLKNALISFVTGFGDIGKNIVEGIKDGFEGAWDNMVAGVKAKAQKLVDEVKSVFDIHSPSKVFEQIGAYCVEGFEIGMEDFTDGTVLNGVETTLNGLSSVSVSAGSSGAVYNQTINVNQQIASADELARRVRLESRYGLMRGVALG